MQRIAIETWTIRVVDQVQSGQPNEDSLVELKREWPKEHQKAARRIAGHANASRGEPILWIVGVDPQGSDADARVPGATDSDLASWWKATSAFFDDGVAPDLFSLNVPIGDRTVLALQFDTNRAPFVITGMPHGAVQREVPWRDGTEVRSARRQDVLRLLVPLQPLPTIESVACRLEHVEGGNPPAGKANFHLTWTMFVVPVSIQAPSSAALHRSSLALFLEDGTSLHSQTAPPFKPEAGASSGALFINIPRMIDLKATLTLDSSLLHTQSAVRARLALWIAGADRAVVIEPTMAPTGAHGRWIAMNG